VLLTVAVMAWSQGMYWESNTAVMGNNVVTKTSYMPGKMRIDGDKESSILRFDQEKMYVVHPDNKTYQEMTFAELEAQMKQMNVRMNKQMEEMQEKMKDMPKEQREMMEKMMGQSTTGKGADAKIDVKATGETKSVIGRPCVKYVINSDGKQAAAIWATKDAKEFASMRKDMESYAKRFLALRGPGGKGIGDAMTKIPGFPMEMDMGSGVTTKVTKIESRAISATAFDIPAGYTKEEKKLEEEPKEK
jgi:hypothetical protein